MFFLPLRLLISLLGKDPDLPFLDLPFLGDLTFLGLWKVSGLPGICWNFSRCDFFSAIQRFPGNPVVILQPPDKTQRITLDHH